MRATLACLIAIVGVMLLATPTTAEPAESSTTADPVPAACFPTCRVGYVCSPAGTCVSECNPMCGDSETCSRGSCIAASSPLATETEKPVTISVRAGGLYQYWKISGTESGTGTPVAVGYTGVVGGVEIGVERLHLLAIPGFAAVFGTRSQVELGVDMGVRFAKRLSSGRAGVNALFTPMLFPGVSSNGQGFYWGGRVEVFYELRRLALFAGIGYGHIATFSPDTTVNWYELGASYRL